jgi:aspartate/tyrosine/aromatic aminotransferase
LQPLCLGREPKAKVATVVPSALSRKHQLKVVYTKETKLQKEVRLTSHRDEFAKEVRQNIQNGAKSHFQLQNGLLWYKQN